MIFTICVKEIIMFTFLWEYVWGCPPVIDRGTIDSTCRKIEEIDQWEESKIPGRAKTQFKVDNDTFPK